MNMTCDRCDVVKGQGWYKNKVTMNSDMLPSPRCSVVLIEDLGLQMLPFLIVKIVYSIHYEMIIIVRLLIDFS